MKAIHPARASHLGLVFALFLAGSGLLTVLPVRATSVLDVKGTFGQANKNYLEGRYDQAVAGYLKLKEAGIEHPDLYYNLADAYYRSGQKGWAVLYFEKSLGLDPGDEAARFNLALVQKELVDRVVMHEGSAMGEPLWHDFIRRLSPGWLTGLFVFFYFLTFSILLARRAIRLQPLHPLLFWINVPILSLALILGLMLGSRIYLQKQVHHAVVIAPVVKLLEGPQPTAKVLMEVHEGLKVRLLSEVSDYHRVRLANGVEGFVQLSQVSEI